MKKWKVFILSLLLVMALMPLTAMAEQFNSEASQEDPWVPKKKTSYLIIIGASRVVQMKEAVGTQSFEKDGVIWQPVYIAKSGKGYKWFKKTAVPKLKKYLKIHPDSKVVIQMGNNDMRYSRSLNFSSYKSTYRQLIRKYRKASFYFMDALPSKSKSENKKRTTFNNKLKKTFKKQYIGGFKYLKKAGIKYKSKKDTVHYSPGTYIKIYKYILKQVYR